MFLFRLVFYSRSRITELGNSVAKEMRAILDASVRNNPPAGLTGALIFNDQYFAQILEGDRAAVTRSFCKIAADPRHSNQVIVEAKPIEQRMFTDWSMAYAGHSDEIDLLYLKHSVTIGLNPRTMTAASLTAFIADLVRSDARVAHTSISQSGDAISGPRIAPAAKKSAAG
ncbi:MAG: BLUF domain-containing protein [Rhodobiaceae bacterium]|nr:BLUF domain-containing protein [Rhodobiaceae bacterium]